jgi:hypothetical protein
VHVAVQPFTLTVAVSVNDPDAPAVTFTVDPVDDPDIVPFPLTCQVNVAPGTGLDTVKVLPVEPGQTFAGPAMVQVGCGVTVTVLVQVATHPLLVTVAVSVNEPDAPAVTLTEVPVVEPMMVPFPEMIQE